nr:disease resistance protein RPM1-like [Ziziphus jujuba var. spinosa]
METNPHLTSITRILSLSYNDLPYYLKSCLLYMGMYPKNCSIRCSRLIRQWIAEGFVKQKKDKTLEAIALEYLTELIHRSLVQVSWEELDGKVRICHIHDLLHEVILKKMENASFCNVLSGDKSTSKGEMVTRRLSIVNSSCNALYCTHQISGVRSILNFNCEGILLETFIQCTLTKNFKLLKVLDFENGILDSIHEDIGNLFHLRYLSLRKTRVNKLPRSIGKLVNLETLDLKQSFVFELPAEIKSLNKLRHLSAYNQDQTMHYGVEEIKELRKLTQLRRLGIEKLKSEDGKYLCWSIEEMKHLESLDVRAINEDEIIDLECITSPPQFLQHLYLYGRLRKLPKWITKLQNLSRMEIFLSRLKEDPMRSLKNLHNLLELMITRDAYDEEGSLLNLESLYIGPSPQLKEVPSGIRHLKKLGILEFYDMSDEFIKSVHSEGKHHQIVQHVPVIVIHYACGGGEYETIRLQ